MLVRPLSARSAALSLLLGAHPPALTARELVATVAGLGIAEPTVRVALTRMVAAGDLVRVDGVHRLSERLLARQRRQDDAVAPAVTPWDGSWETAVVVGPARAASERAELRQRLTGLRLGELREGVWLRPANLQRPWPSDVGEQVRRLDARPDGDPVLLAEELWQLDGWAGAGRALLQRYGAADEPADRFATAAAVVRHLVTDPVLPAELLPDDWPGAALRAAYAGYRDEVAALATSGRVAGAT